LSETAEADERPLTAAIFKETIQQITDGMLRQQLELQSQQQRFLQQFVEQMAQRLVPSEPFVLNIEPHDAGEEERPPENGDTPDSVISAARSRDSANGSQRQSGIKVSWLATQIPEFGGTSDESVRQWVRRVDKVAHVHGASDGVILLAASSRLIKSAKKWYDIQTGAVIESWSNLKSDLIKIFERKLSFFRAMQKAESRKWSASKETFDQYAIDKLALLHQLNLPESDTIHLLISGISQSSLIAIALSVANESLDSFLEKMQCITEGLSDGEKKLFPVQSANTSTELTCRNCGKKGHEAKMCKSEAICFYCKATGHRRLECPKLSAKTVAQGSQPRGTQLAAPVSEVEVADSSQAEAVNELVALVKEDDDRTRRGIFDQGRQYL